MDTDRPTSLPLDELLLTVVVDNETDSLSSVDAGIPQLPEIATHLLHTPPSGRHDGHDGVQVFDRLCVACHGLSVLARARRGEQAHTVLFDVGPYGDVWLDNAERLEVDLGAIDTVFLSHWHWDHSGGLPVVVAAIAAARRAAGRPAPVLDLHPDRPDQRGVQVGDGPMVLLPPEPGFDELTRVGGDVRTSADAHDLGGGLLLASGAIARTTAYETGLDGHHSFRAGTAVPDPLIMDERFLAAQVAGRGVSVLSACSHAGIVNACLGAKEHFPGTPVDVVLGGFHLAGASVEGRIGPTVRDLDEQVGPRVVAPGHCTGWRAEAALAARFAPGRYAPSVVGSTYILTAP